MYFLPVIFKLFFLKHVNETNPGKNIEEKGYKRMVIASRRRFKASYITL